MGLHLHPITEQAERRKSARVSVRISATLIFGGIAVPCTIRDLSATGAAVLLPDGTDVPDRLTMAIVGKPARHACRVVWRMSPLVALKFEGV